MSDINQYTATGRLGADAETLAEISSVEIGVIRRFLRRASFGHWDHCWEWTGSRAQGYGTISTHKNHSPMRVHRLSYLLFNGQLRHGEIVRHKCDNPACYNPFHLEKGTHRDNAIDCERRGRRNPISRLNLNHSRALSQRQVLDIQKMHFCAVNGRGPGMRVRDVAKTYGVCPDIISRVKNGSYHV